MLLIVPERDWSVLASIIGARKTRKTRQSGFGLEPACAACVGGGMASVMSVTDGSGQVLREEKTAEARKRAWSRTSAGQDSVMSRKRSASPANRARVDSS